MKIKIFFVIFCVLILVIMSFPFFIASRYLKSRKDSKFISVISAISIGGIALGVTVLIITLNVLEGFENAVEKKVTGFNSHIYITSFSKKNLDPYPEVLPFIEKQIGTLLTNTSPFVLKTAMLKAGKYNDGIAVYGIIPDRGAPGLKKYISSGSYSFNYTGTSDGILVGKKLADKLSIKLNDKIVLFGLQGDKLPDFENPPGIMQFYVTGIYESGMAEYDDKRVYISFDAAQNLFALDGFLSGYNIELSKVSAADSIAGKLQSFFGYPYNVKTVFEMYSNIFTWLELQKKPIPIILGLIIIVAVFNIIGTLLMIIIEKTSDIGILKSLGAKNSLILRIYLLQGIIISCIGIITGNLIAVIVTFMQNEFNIISLPSEIYFISSFDISFNIQNYIVVSAGTFILTIIASVLPSATAAKIRPVKSLRFE